MEPASHPHRGFQSKYFLNHLFRRQTVERMLAEERIHSPPKKEEAPSPEKLTSEKLDDLIEQSQAPLYRMKTAIPLNPFPDRVIIDVNKITVIYKYFFWSEQIHSVFIKDISDVLVETGLFWSTLCLIDVGFTENSIDIKYLKTREAVKARKVIQGLIVAHKNGLELTKYTGEDLMEKLEELGKAEQAI